jgi:Leucine-rich repeat (LRR) protein
MMMHKIVLLLFLTFSKSAASIEIDCEIRGDPNYQNLFENMEYYLKPDNKTCGFKVNESESSSEINFDFPVDNQTDYLSFIYTNTSIPILPAELFQKFADKTLGCGFFNLASIKIERDWFKHSENLSNLFFFNNWIPKLEAGKFLDLKNLFTLNLHHNFLKEIDEKAFAGLDNLNLLILALNKIEFLHPDVFRNLPSLETLILKGNRLKKVTGLFTNLENLTLLMIGRNPLKALAVGSFTGLKKLLDLNCGGIRMTSVHPDLFKELVTLEKLHVHLNQIKELDEKVFGNLIKLEILNLKQNKLKYLPEKLFENLTSLRELYFDGNPLKALDENQFKNLVNLEGIWIIGSRFESVPDGIFKNNGKLTRITMQANISRMSRKVFSHLEKLDQIDLADNYCVSVEIKEHNLSVFFTEELLIPCSCKTLDDVVSGSGFAGLLIFGAAMIMASLICYLMWKNAKVLNNLRAVKGALH